MGLLITPPADFTKAVAARQIPFFSSPGNANMPLQSAVWGSRVCWWAASNAGAGNLSGSGQAASTAGTFSNPAQATTNLWTLQFRGAFATVVSTLNQQVGIRFGSVEWARVTSSGQGGFFFVCRFGLDAWTSGDRLFVGLANSTGVVCTAQPSAGTDLCGFGVDASDTAITFMHNDASGTATKDTISGQPTLQIGQGYDAYMFMKPNDSTLYYRLDDVTAGGTTLIDTSTGTDLPTSGTFLGEVVATGNAANTAGAAAKVGIVSVYVETDR